jgi:adenylate cyclase
MHAQGRVLFFVGRYAEAEALFRRRLIHMPTSDVTRAYLASLCGHTNRPEEARQVWRELMAINPQYTIDLTLRILPYTNPAPLEHFVEGLRKAGLPEQS